MQLFLHTLFSRLCHEAHATLLRWVRFKVSSSDISLGDRHCASRVSACMWKMASYSSVSTVPEHDGSSIGFIC